MPKSATAQTALTPEELSRLISYDSSSGKLYWRVERISFGRKVRPGVEAGTPDRHGYTTIVIDGLVYWAHRLAWYLHYGTWPTGQIDHINLDHRDNRIENLRQASMTEQRANQRVRVDSKSGVKGVRLTRTGRWSARIKGHSLGTYDTPEQAADAYAAAAHKVFGDFARIS